MASCVMRVDQPRDDQVLRRTTRGAHRISGYSYGKIPALYRFVGTFKYNSSFTSLRSTTGLDLTWFEWSLQKNQV